MKPAVLNITEAACVLSCRKASIVRLTREGRIPYRRIGRRLVFITAELDLWLSRLPGVSVVDAVAASHAQPHKPPPRLKRVPARKRLLAKAAGG